MNRRAFLTRMAGAATCASWMSPALAAPAASPGALADHRLAAIEIKRVRLPWPRLVGKNARLDIHGRGPSPEICILKTDQGASGWGMIRGNAQTVRGIEPEAVGKTVADLFVPEKGIRSDKLACLDIALHDLAGVILNVPVWKLIGGKGPAATKAYSGMIYFDDLEPAGNPAGIDKVLEECRWDIQYGYRQLKAKIGRGNKWMPAAAGLERDIEVVRAIAKAFPDSEILVDGNNGFTADTAIAFLKGLKGVPLFWVEEPFHETLADWRKLNSWMQANGYGKTYRADGEANPDEPVLDQLGAEGAVNIRLEDIMGLGFTRWRAFLPDLERRKIGASPHNWGEGLKTVYSAHLAAGLGNIPTLEGVTCGDEDVDFGQNRLVDGKFQVSSAPGFGLKLRKA